MYFIALPVPDVHRLF